MYVATTSLKALLKQQGYWHGLRLETWLDNWKWLCGGFADPCQAEEAREEIERLRTEAVR
ncbi:MAG: hypothetical protein ACYTFK_13740 [Planctomycetota bacterium]|jgi:hypothetical protein